MSQPRPCLLITPTTSEYKPVKTAIDRWLAQGHVQLEMCGMGPDRAGAFAEHLERSGPWGGLALVGWAGGVRPELARGDVVLAESALDEDGHQVPCTTIELPGARNGAMLTVREPLLTVESKRAAEHRGAVAVEMEAYPLAAWAAEHNTPFVHARVILDSAHDSLPDMGQAMDPFGRVGPGRLARLLAGQPRLAAELWPMAQQLRRLRPVLGSLALAIVKAWRT